MRCLHVSEYEREPQVQLRKATVGLPTVALIGVASCERLRRSGRMAPATRSHPEVHLKNHLRNLTDVSAATSVSHTMRMAPEIADFR
jgi:hypothetical protein